VPVNHFLEKEEEEYLFWLCSDLWVVGFFFKKKIIIPKGEREKFCFSSITSNNPTRDHNLYKNMYTTTKNNVSFIYYSSIWGDSKEKNNQKK
jgi:hypothetical protein